MRLRVALLGLFALAMTACSADAGHEPTNAAEEPGCEGRGETIVVGMSEASEDGLVTAVLTDATPLPPVQGINSWTVEVSDDGSPVLDEGAGDSQVIANIFMAEHDHNIRKLGTMTEPGVFQIPDFALTMNGYWEITIEVWPDMSTNDSEHEDTVFGFCVRN